MCIERDKQNISQRKLRLVEESADMMTWTFSFVLRCGTPCPQLSFTPYVPSTPYVTGPLTLRYDEPKNGF
jgi:hypothetical protein